ncbi:hypothetical protein H4R34_000128 [Dimargaris verticillata]|uniref:Gluconokinase n=1 Tax=Dimargaris verticillata TaxID=2761393 RepID=A0A9W8B7Q2_9FUNG|nr:hypothetical protein H4R34_000128 [Dimargaris verticillata]
MRRTGHQVQGPILLVVMGMSASGKSHIGQLLNRELAHQQGLVVTFVEGDDFHSKACVAQMHRGQGLSDAQRWPWLEAIRDHCAAIVSSDIVSHTAIVAHRNRHVVILACSLLKQCYRDYIRELATNASTTADGQHVGVYGRAMLVYLNCSRQELVRRAQSRPHHFANDSLLQSQFDALESPNPKTEEDVVVVDGDQRDMAIVSSILDKFQAIY